MFTFNHFNFNVFDLERSLKFYDEALGLKPMREKNAADGSYKLVFLGDGSSDFTLDMTSASRSFTLPSLPRTWKKRTKSTQKWAAYALKTPPWASTSSRTPTGTG